MPIKFVFQGVSRDVEVHFIPVHLQLHFRSNRLVVYKGDIPYKVFIYFSLSYFFNFRNMVQTTTTCTGRNRLVLFSV